MSEQGARTTAAVNAKTFTELWLPVGELEIDREIQRANLDTRKVERFLKNFNPAALGVITVSERNPVTKVILDGMHRWEVVRRLTDNQGKMLAHVFKDLAHEEEAQMFLDLNAGNQPSLLDKFRVRVVAGDPVATEISALARSFGWTIALSPNKGNLSAVGALERIHRKSLLIEAEPGLVQATLMVVTHAWGLEREGVQAVMLEGVAALIAEHGSLLSLDRLEKKLKGYPGGPHGLHTDASAFAAIKKGKVTMAIAEQITDEYNKGGRLARPLPVWRRRT